MPGGGTPASLSCTPHEQLLLGREFDILSLIVEHELGESAVKRVLPHPVHIVLVEGSVHSRGRGRG